MIKQPFPLKSLIFHLG